MIETQTFVQRQLPFCNFEIKKYIHFEANTTK